MKMVTTVKTLLHTLLEDLTFSLRITFELNISTKSSLVLFILDYRAFVSEPLLQLNGRNIKKPTCN